MGKAGSLMCWRGGTVALGSAFQDASYNLRDQASRGVNSVRHR